jgi:hypothetical protein
MVLENSTEVRRVNTYEQVESGRGDRGSKEMDGCPLTDSLNIVDFPRPHLLLPQQHRMSLGRIGTGPHDTTAPSAITWTPIYGRLGTRRLGTVVPCISFIN